MRRTLQFAGWMLALGMSAAMAAPCPAQGPRVYRVQQNRPVNRPPKTPKQQQRQAQRQAQRQQQQNSGANRPPNSNANRPGTAAQQNNPNRPPSSYTPPAQRKFNDLSPQDRQKVLRNYNDYKNLTPAQKQEKIEAAHNWGTLTQQQQNHIRNDIAPKWRQMLPERRQAIRQRLRVLQNMPESARNQRLNDPNFTRGMSEEDKATLHDLSHMHVGGAPDPPNE
jgi:hypothetical protein